MQDQYDQQNPIEEFEASPADAPPTRAGDFVPLRPPEGWPTVIGVLSIIFGSLGSLQGFCGLLSLILMAVVVPLLPQEMKDQMGQQMQSSAPYPVPQALVTLLELVGSVMLLVGGIFLVKRRAKAAGVLTAYAVVDLVANTCGSVLAYFALRAQMAHLQNDPQMQQVPSWMLNIMKNMGPVVIPIGWVLVSIWPVFLLLWFRRAKIRASMAAWG